jgi:glycosyltransferase involved in cell wall biosynthesis
MALLVTWAEGDSHATLDVVGRSAVSSYTSALERYVDDLGLGGAVRFTGGLSDADLVAAMAGADLLMMTSRHEGFGVPALEAMSLGLPVVANDAGALPEIVGDAGLLVDATDPWAVAHAAARVVADETLRASLRAAGSRRLAELDLPSAADRAVEQLAALRG